MTEDFHKPTEPTEPTEPADPADESAERVEPATGSTGQAQVDEVLRSLDELEGRPVTEHVAVFEAAHEALRSALSDAGRPSQRG